MIANKLTESIVDKQLAKSFYYLFWFYEMQQRFKKGNRYFFISILLQVDSRREKYLKELCQKS